MQTFQYPNLLSGTRSGEGWIRGGSGAGGNYNAGTGIELYNDGSSECSLYSPPVVMHTGTDYTLSCFAANTDNMKGTKWCVINKATGSLAAYRMLDNPGPGGVWLTEHIHLFDNAADGAQYFVRFDNEGTTDGERCLIWFRDIMLTEGAPHAWAPAEGETLAGGGALMSANLWDVSAANLKPDADGVYNVGKTAGELSCSIAGASALTENQTIHMGASLRGADKGCLKPFVGYKDAAGNLNWTGFPAWTPTDQWQRFEGSCVVPSGLTLTNFGFNVSGATGDIEVMNPAWSYGSPVCLASSVHTPYATQDHVAAEYATKAALKVTDNSVKAEVTARTKTDRMVSEVSSRLTQTADGFNASIDRLSDTDKKVNSWFGFGSDSSGNPQLTMGSSSSPIVGVYTNTGLAYKARSGATLLELDGASRSSTMPHVHADDVSIGSWQWVPTQNGTHFTLQWIGG